MGRAESAGANPVAAGLFGFQQLPVGSRHKLLGGDIAVGVLIGLESDAGGDLYA